MTSTPNEQPPTQDVPEVLPENIPPLQEPPLDAAADLGTAPLSTDAQRGQQGPASEQTGAEQTGVDDTGREAATPAGQPRQPQPSQQAPAGDPDDVIGVGSARTSEEIPDASTWATGDEPMTDAQRRFLGTLARDAGETLPGNLTKAQASEHIDRLQQLTGRGSQG